MIYMVEHIYTRLDTEQEWNDWYKGYLRVLLGVPGFHTAQRFKAVADIPPRYMAIYSVESAAVFDSSAYKNIGGGGGQSSRFHPAYKIWNRNLFEGADLAPAIGNGQRVLVFDSAMPDRNLAMGQQPLWLKSVGLHMTTPYRALIVLDAKVAKGALDTRDGFVYEPITPPLAARCRLGPGSSRIN